MSYNIGILLDNFVIFFVLQGLNQECPVFVIVLFQHSIKVHIALAYIELSQFFQSLNQFHFLFGLLCSILKQFHWVVCLRLFLFLDLQCWEFTVLDMKVLMAKDFLSGSLGWKCIGQTRLLGGGTWNGSHSQKDYLYREKKSYFLIQ